jgi:hypothetical protein
MNYAIYDSTGRIVRNVIVPPAAIKLQLQSGESYVEGDFPLAKFYVDGGAAVPFPPAPGSSYTWDWPTKSWVFDLPTGIAAAWARIKAARDATLGGTFTWNGWVFDADADSQQRIFVASLAGQPVTWTLHDNTTVDLTAAQLQQLWHALFTAFQEAFTRGQLLRAKIATATTQAELDAITW